MRGMVLIEGLTCGGTRSVGLAIDLLGLKEGIAPDIASLPYISQNPGRAQS